MLQDFPPCTVFRSTATMAFVDHDEVEEAGRELPVELLPLLGAGQRLIKPEIDLIGRVHPALLVYGSWQLNLATIVAFDGFRVRGQLGHRRAKRAEVVDHGLIDQHVPVGEEQNALPVPAFPKPPYDLERGVGLARARRHDEQDAVFTLGNRLHGGIGCVDLIVARGLDDQPFEIPEGWLWLPLGETGNIFSGNSINEITRERLSKTQSGRPFIATKDVGYGLDELAYENGLLVPDVDTTFKIARPNTPLICSEGGSAGRKIGLCDREICFGNKLIANEPWSKISPRYVLYVYLSPFFYEEFRSRMTGVIGGISLNRFIELPFPLPPFGEQQRIVGKVDELMSICDQLEAARLDREGQREKLTLSSLAKLNEPDSETFAADARFALENLEPLTKRTDQIKQIRQTILNLAVRGKLVAQDANDEPARTLLGHIAKEKQAIAAQRSHKLKTAIQREYNDEPFGLPTGWIWCQLDELAWKITDGDHLTPKRESSGHYLLSARNVHNGRIDLSNVDYVGPEEFSRMRARCDPDRNDILISCSGSVGRVAIVDRDESYALVRSAALVKLALPSQLARYISLALISSCLQEQMGVRSKAAAQPNLFLGSIRQLILPLPPLAEQHRIVAKVDELMALCDQLEASLVEGEQTRSKLLEAVLHQALEPA